QLLTTARRIARLVAVAEEPLPVPALQVVETTATPAGDATAAGRSVGVSQDDLLNDPVLRARLTRPKPVILVSVKDWPAGTGTQRRRVAAQIAHAAVGLLDAPGPGDAAHTVGCYVNTVGMAVETAKAL